MPRKRHSEERIIYALKQIEGGAKGLEMCRELGISEALCIIGRRGMQGWG
jgi:hypothetical protein